MRGARYLILAAVLLAAWCTSAPATYLTIFSDNFDSENGGKGKNDYGKFANWTVPHGWGVDLAPEPKKKKGHSPPGPANGLFVDLVGAKHGGLMQLKKALLLQPGSYILEFDLAGSLEPRGGKSVAEITVSGTTVSGITMSGISMAGITGGNGAVTLFQESFPVQAGDPWTHYSGEFVVSAPTSVSLSLLGTGKDHQGPLIDNLVLAGQEVPLPPTLALTGAGLLALLLRRRRRRWGRQP
jgi:hypothetical protein